MRVTEPQIRVLKTLTTGNWAPRCGSNQTSARKRIVNIVSAKALVEKGLVERLYWQWSYRFKITPEGLRVLSLHRKN
jgi:hypothetical protein